MYGISVLAKQNWPIPASFLQEVEGWLWELFVESWPSHLKTSLYEQPPTSSLSNLEIMSKMDIVFSYVLNEDFTINVSSLHLSWRPDFCIMISAVPPFHPIQTQGKMMHFQVSNQSSSFCVVNGPLPWEKGEGERKHMFCAVIELCQVVPKTECDCLHMWAALYSDELTTHRTQPFLFEEMLVKEREQLCFQHWHHQCLDNETSRKKYKHWKQHLCRLILFF